jgi:hypothetical protein
LLAAGSTRKVKVKAVAAFIGFGFKFTPRGYEEHGLYQLNFTFRGQHAEIIQPDKTQYSREDAKRAAEVMFNSGQVEAYATNQIQTWIHLGL